jgi:hypothetical protein
LGRICPRKQNAGCHPEQQYAKHQPVGLFQATTIALAGSCAVIGPPNLQEKLAGSKVTQQDAHYRPLPVKG